MKKGFTLAEVLITLGIIGVVAAVTLPTLVQNYKKTVYVNQLKKFVSTFEQGLQKMLADEGVQRLSDLPDLGTDYEIWRNPIGAKDFIDDFLGKGFYVTYKNAPGYLAEGFGGEDGYTDHLQFNDGNAIISLGAEGQNASHKLPVECDIIKSNGGTMCSAFMHFAVDINGVKGPNKLGRDIFIFWASDEAKLYPLGGKDIALYLNPTPLESNSNYWKNTNECDGNSSNRFCAARIIENGWKMDY